MFCLECVRMFFNSNIVIYFDVFKAIFSVHLKKKMGFWGVLGVFFDTLKWFMSFGSHTV